MVSVILRRKTEDLLELVAMGYSNGYIAALYGLSKGTIEKDLRDVYKELGCVAETAHCKRVEAVAIAFRKGILN